MINHDLPIMEDDLHAYVDGELPAGRRAAVEAWLAAHADDAARVGAWRAQAEMIRNRYGGTVLEPVPSKLDAARLRRIERRWFRPALVAVVAAFALGGLSGWFGHDVLEGESRYANTATADAIDAYKLYVVEVRHPVEVPGAEEPHLVQWLSKRLGYGVRAPDLGPIGLKLVGGRLLPGPGGPAAFLMYEGPSGDRYTVYCARSNSPETALRYRAVDQVAAYYWIDDSRVYVVSGPADRDRLLRVARSAYDQLEAGDQKNRG